MQRILTVEQMQNADKYTIETLGIPESVLVERAGCAVAEEITKKFKGGRVLVVAGKGNNGADAVVVAEELSLVHGFKVTLLKTEENDLSKLNGKFDIVVDGIFGTGLKREVSGFYAELINKINAIDAYKISIDIPSGLDGNSGVPLGVAVKSDFTVSIQEFKIGQFLNDGPDYTGDIVAKDIGISVWDDECAYKLEDKDIEKFFPKRSRNTHKGSYGKAAIVGGSKSFFGSAMLAGLSLSALRLGAGYSHLCIPDSLFPVYAGKCPECTLGTLNDIDGNIVFDKDGLDKLLGYDTIAIGMGIGKSEEVYKTIKYLLSNFGGKLIIDADGLNSLAEYGVSVLRNAKPDVLLTPHIKEFSRLSALSVDEILKNSVEIAKTFANEYGVNVILKNAVSVITDGESVCLNVTGSPAMAKCGSGDVLAGVIAGISARKFGLYESACSGAYIFGKAGERCAKEIGEYSVTATDLINAIPKGE